MKTTEQIQAWLEAGKQLGKVFSYEHDGQVYWSSVAIQKWDGKYKLYIDEIAESAMVSEGYCREELYNLLNFDELVNAVNLKSRIQIYDMTPCKGQKIFNPAFD